MARLLDQKKARKLLEGLDYTMVRGEKHNVKMVKRGKPPITLPYHGGQTYSKGLSAAIRKQAGL